MRIMSITQEEADNAFATRKKGGRPMQDFDPINRTVFDLLEVGGAIKIVLGCPKEADTLQKSLTRNSRLNRLDYEFTRKKAVVYGRKVQA